VNAGDLLLLLHDLLLLQMQMLEVRTSGCAADPVVPLLQGPCLRKATSVLGFQPPPPCPIQGKEGQEGTVLVS